MRKATIVAAALVILFSSTLQAEALAANALPPGILRISPPRPVPHFQLPDTNGVATNTRDFAGKWLLVHFWASWCGPCRRELPMIQASIKQHSPDQLQWLLVNTAESEDTIFAFLGSVAPELNTLMDSDGLVTEQWQPRGLPTTFFVDPQGRARYMAIGGRDWTAPLYKGFLSGLNIDTPQETGQ